MSGAHHGLIDNWLAKIKELYLRNHERLDAIADSEAKADALCELNVADQVEALSRTATVQDAWYRGQSLEIHGWIYGLKDGLVNDLGVRVNRVDQVPPQLRFERQR
jgi:carbonic anhydrase